MGLTRFERCSVSFESTLLRNPAIAESAWYVGTDRNGTHCFLVPVRNTWYVYGTRTIDEMSIFQRSGEYASLTTTIGILIPILRRAHAFPREGGPIPDLSYI